MTDSRVEYGNLAGCESEESPLGFGNRPLHSSGQIGILCSLHLILAKEHGDSSLLTPHPYQPRSDVQ